MSYRGSGKVLGGYMLGILVNFFKKKDWVYYDRCDKLKAKWGEEYLSRRCNNTGIVQHRVPYYMMIPETRGVLNLKLVNVKGGIVMQYVRRYLQEVEVIERTDKIVRYSNEWKAECVMCTKQFDEFYEEIRDER